jgi:hypothetical protein
LCRFLSIRFRAGVYTGEICRLLPPGGNQNTVNKYHITKKALYGLKPSLFNYRLISIKIEITWQLFSLSSPNRISKIRQNFMFWDKIKDEELDRQSGREIGRRELHKIHSFTL